ncbi:Flagellar hook-length control protein [Buchnera aphidicola (Eriosoma lanigerum)]|uniref:hypothetical protein n=1 Tax=Buchnera aphidicola TaxID=9 RepID=UPI0034645AE7
MLFEINSKLFTNYVEKNKYSDNRSNNFKLKLNSFNSIYKKEKKDNLYINKSILYKNRNKKKYLYDISYDFILNNWIKYVDYDSSIRNYNFLNCINRSTSLYDHLMKKNYFLKSLCSNKYNSQYNHNNVNYQKNNLINNIKFFFNQQVSNYNNCINNNVHTNNELYKVKIFDNHLIVNNSSYKNYINNYFVLTVQLDKEFNFNDIIFNYFNNIIFVNNVLFINNVSNKIINKFSVCDMNNISFSNIHFIVEQLLNKLFLTAELKNKIFEQILIFKLKKISAVQLHIYSKDKGFIYIALNILNNNLNLNFMSLDSTMRLDFISFLSDLRKKIKKNRIKFNEIVIHDHSFFLQQKKYNNININYDYNHKLKYNRKTVQLFPSENYNLVMLHFNDVHHVYV